MEKQVFISRPLNAGQRDRLRACGYEATAYSLLRLTGLEVTEIPAADWWFFYSRNGVAYLSGSRPKEFFTRYRRQHPQLKIAAVGPGTAACLRQFGVEADFTGDGHPDSTAKAFLRHARGQRVLFIQSQNSRCSVEKSCGKHIEATRLAVYASECDPARTAPPNAAAYLLTSPLNATAALQPFRHNSAKLPALYAIGPVTAGHIEQLGFGPAPYPTPATVDSLIELFCSSKQAGVP